MTQPDTKLNFFRQSGWMMLSNLLFGFFMMSVAPFAAQLQNAEYPVFMTVLRIFVLITIPALAIQTILAQQTAAAITDEAQRDLSATIRGVFKITFVYWLILVVIAILFRAQIMEMCKATDPNVVWAMLLLILGALWAPIFFGLLQGMQNFLLFGFAMIANGVGRLLSVAFGVQMFQIAAAGATVGAAMGYVAAIALGVGPTLALFKPAPRKFDAWKFLKKLLPITAGAGSTLFIINVDMPLVQSHFPKEMSRFYSAAETIGIALITLCGPVASVMFPKIVRSRATSTSSDALKLAVMGTAILGGSAALVCTLFPRLPLQIMFFKSPELHAAYPMIPWFMWAMVPLSMYNVLVNNLIAREHYAILKWSAALPIAYTITLYLYLQKKTIGVTDVDPMVFHRIIQILMAFNSALCALAIYYSVRAANAEARSPSTAATPS